MVNYFIKEALEDIAPEFYDLSDFLSEEEIKEIEEYEPNISKVLKMIKKEKNNTTISDND